MMKLQLEHSAKNRKITGLDGLRGIAILGVIGYHLAPEIFPGGFFGVNLFFVLSGYLMAITSRRAQAGAGFHALAFYRRRATRVYPALALCVSGTLCAAWLLTPDVLTGIRGLLPLRTCGHWRLKCSSISSGHYCFGYLPFWSDSQRQPRLGGRF